MGRYIDWADVTGRYNSFANGPDASAAGSWIIPQAEAEVDGRLAVRYSVPFSPVPELVRDLCIDLAFYKANIRQKTSELIWNSLEARFKAIVDGTMVLTTSAGALGSASGSAWVSNTYHTSFGIDDDVNWNVDRNWIEDTQGSREGSISVTPDDGDVDVTILDELQDVVISSPAFGQSLVFDGTNWINSSSTADADGILTYYIKNGATINGLTIVTGTVDDAQADINRQAIQAFIDLADTTEAQIFVSSETFEIYGGPVIFRATAFGIKWRGQLSTTLRQRSNNVAVLQLGDTGGGGQVIGLDFDGATLHYLNDQTGNTGANLLVIGNQWTGKARNIRCANTITFARPYRDVYWPGGSSVFSCYFENIYAFQGLQSLWDVENFGTGNVLSNIYCSGVGPSGTAQVVVRPVEIRVGSGSQIHDSSISQFNLEWVITNRAVYFSNWRSVKFDSFHMEHISLSGANACFIWNEISTVQIDGLMFLDNHINNADVTDSVPSIFRFFNDGTTTVDTFTWVNNTGSNVDMEFYLQYQADNEGVDSTSGRLYLNSPQFVDGSGTSIADNMIISRDMGGTDRTGGVWGPSYLRSAAAIRCGGAVTKIIEGKFRIPDVDKTVYGQQIEDGEIVVLVHAGNRVLTLWDKMGPASSRWAGVDIDTNTVLTIVVLGTSTGTTRVNNYDGTEIFTHPTATATTRYNVYKNSSGNWVAA